MLSEAKHLVFRFFGPAALRMTVLLCVFSCGFSYASEQEDLYANLQPVQYSAPELLTFEELKSLSKNPAADLKIKQKVETLFTTPMVSNEAFYRGARPHRPRDFRLGNYLRAVSWNIEKSIHMKEAIAAFTDHNKFKTLMDAEKFPADSKRYKEAMLQRFLLEEADLVILQEMDIGHKRSGYLDAARELAAALDMNYAYGAEQLELDPAYLGTEQITLEGGTKDVEAETFFRANSEKYKGIFGSAVLSKYPILDVRVFQLKHQAYDWYEQEKDKTTFLENTRRFGAKTVFENELHREMKIGGRIFFRVDLYVPDLPEKRLTVINIHLEIKCEPKGREEQLAEILSYIQDIHNPVIVAGDFNSAPSDLSPTSLTRVAERSLKDPSNWLGIGINYFSPAPFATNTVRSVSNLTKNLQNPLAWHIPVVAPNKVKKLFEMVEDYRFSDGRGFDFRGDKSRSINGKSGVLANSNQRDLKGFKTTFSVKRSIAHVIGKYRLDWFFIKSYLTDPQDKSGSYTFAPHFGYTLEEMNTALKEPISDHHPNVVDLPFDETAYK